MTHGGGGGTRARGWAALGAAAMHKGGGAGERRGVRRGLGGAAARRGCGGAAWGGGEERRGVGLMCLEGGVLGYLYWGGEGFAWGRGQEID